MMKKEPEIDTNPYRSLEAAITPTEFEKFCLETVKAYAQKEGLKDFVILHNQKIEAYDSTYQMDVYAEQTALGCKHKGIIECKRHSGNIKRSVVNDLRAKIESIGAQKGIIMSTSGFQKDAVNCAEQHGIALWQIVDSQIKHFVNSVDPKISLKIACQMEMARYLPKYYVLEWDCKLDFPYEDIYPTTQMYENARTKAIEELKARGNYNV